MDLRRLAGLAVSSVVLLAPMLAQGPVYRERWGFLHLEHRRAELRQLLVGRDDTELAMVARTITRPDQGVPFRPIADAIAHCRGIAVDELFQLRCALSVFVLPEVVDPDSTVAECRQANFAAFLPFAMPIPGEVLLTYVVRDGDGEEVFRAEVDRDTDLEGLRMGRPSASLPAADLADGSYEVEVLATIAGAAPRPDLDCRLRWTFAVLRGYQSRAEFALTDARQRREDLDALPRAILDGLALQVQRAFTGEAYEVRSEAVHELQLLEVALHNLTEKRSVLHGMTGPVSVALPFGDQSLACRVRLAADPDREAPLVVFASATPAYDTTGRRPTEPVVREGRDLEAALAEFAADGRYHVACFGSPGGGRAFFEGLLAALESLSLLQPTGGKKPLLVCDREAAAVVALRAGAISPHVAGLVLVGAGAMPRQVIASLGELPVRVVRLHDYPSSVGLDRLLEFVAAERTAGRTVADVALLHEQELPWPFGVPLSADAIAAFAAQVFRNE